MFRSSCNLRDFSNEDHTNVKVGIVDQVYHV